MTVAFQSVNTMRNEKTGKISADVESRRRKETLCARTRPRYKAA
jgi:hypothetical protein